jgi:hypothetical protein
MGKNIKYLGYVLRHKFHVFKVCWGEGLYWRGLVHDLSKFRPSEWFPYAEFFYGKKKEQARDATGYYKPTNTGNSAFDHAWLLHQHRNDHHWQWWISPQDDGGEVVMQMSPRAVKEMVCDWKGASIAQGFNGRTDLVAWYRKNKTKMRLHPLTREWIEFFLGCHEKGIDSPKCDGAIKSENK